MPYKNKERAKAYKAEHYAQNRDKIIDGLMDRRRKIRQYISDIKEASPCTDCKVHYPYYVMHFDHLDNKLMNISKAMKQWSLKRIKEEIAKCEVVCANCHARRTFERGQHMDSLGR